MHNSEGNGKLKFENHLKHGESNNGNANKAPNDPDISLENSYQVSENSTRRIGEYRESGEFNVFDEHAEGIFMGIPKVGVCFNKI